MHALIRRLFLCTGLGWCVLAGAAPAAQPALILGVHPYLPAGEIVSRFTPLARYLGLALGRRVDVRVGRTYDEHILALGAGDIDVAYMGPVPYVRAVERFGPFPLLARQVVGGDPLLHGAIIVRTDSPLRRVADLKGHCVALGDPESTMSYILPRRLLELDGVPLDSLRELRHVEGHLNVAMAVLAGDCDAGAVKGEVVAGLAPRGLRVLAELPAVHDHLFVARATLPPATVERLRSLLLGLAAVPEGRAIMTSIHPGMTALVSPADDDYASLRAMLGMPAPSLLPGPR